MIAVELSTEASWPDADWQGLATRAVEAAVAASPHGLFLASPATVEVSLRLSSDEEIHVLNRQYRGKDKATNVLSFPMVQPDLLDAVTGNSDDGEVLLGDIVVSHGVAAREAEEKGVSLADHLTHLIVHGTLHLLGFDHEQGEAEADAMEEMERAALARLGLPDPYGLHGG